MSSIINDILKLVKNSPDVMSTEKLREEYDKKYGKMSYKDLILSGFPIELIDMHNEMLSMNDPQKAQQAFSELMEAIKMLPPEKKRGVRLV